MKEINIGRSSKNHLVIDDPTESISRNHAVLYVHDDGRISIIDKSANGTYLNGRRINRGKEYFITYKDRVVFADKYVLDWSKVRNLSTIGSKTLFNTTNFGKEIKRIFEEITNMGSFGRSIQRFFGVLLGGSAFILELSKDFSTQEAEGKSYFTFSLAFAAIIFSKSALAIYSYKHYLGIELDGLMDFFQEILISLSLGLTTLILAIFTYRLFKFFNGSNEKRWRQYFLIYCYNAGTFFWLVALTLLPMLIYRDIKTDDTLYVVSLFVILFATLWACITWILVNLLFWN